MLAPAGVFSAEEWFNYAAYQKLDGIDGLNAVVDDFEADRLVHDRRHVLGTPEDVHDPEGPLLRRRLQGFLSLRRSHSSRRCPRH